MKRSLSIHEAAELEINKKKDRPQAASNKTSQLSSCLFYVRLRFVVFPTFDVDFNDFSILHIGTWGN